MLCYNKYMVRGFSLLEVIIALAILALLTVAILPNLTSFNATIDTSMKTVANMLYKYSYSSITTKTLVDTTAVTIYEKSSQTFTFLDYQIK